MSINRDYFNGEVSWDGTADYAPSFEHMPNLESLEAASGVVLRPLFGQQMMLSYVTFAPNSVAPVHQHPQEQMTVVLQGKLEFQVGNEKKVIQSGDAVTIPGNVPHGAVAFEEGCVCIDAFAPPREAFKELMKQQEENK
jgi:quercetin dioxygenase-like cupin family protein